MERKILVPVLVSVFFFFLAEPAVNAQIHDIKSKAKENKSKHSDSGKSNSSSRNNSSGSDDVGNCLSGCLDVIFSEMFSSCITAIFSGKNEEQNTTYTPNYQYNSIQNNAPKDTSHMVENTEPFPDMVVNEDSLNKHTGVNYDPPLSQKAKKDSSDLALELGVNIGYGFEYSKDTNYHYINYIPGIRINLNWFAIDYRYNVLTESSSKLPDSFKSWDLIFMFTIKADKKTTIMIGSGMHNENYTDMLYNQHYFGLRTKLVNGRDLLSMNLRLTLDYKTSEIPYSELGIHYNLRFLKTNNLYGYLSFGGVYQNYYSSADIWGGQLGIKFNFH